MVHASKKGRIEIFRYLVDKGINVGSLSRSLDCSPLMKGIKSKSVEIVQCLLAFGINPNIGYKSENGYTYPLQYASKHRNDDVLRLLLLYGADISIFEESSIKEDNIVNELKKLSGQISQQQKTDIIDKIKTFVSSNWNFLGDLEAISKETSKYNNFSMQGVKISYEYLNSVSSNIETVVTKAKDLWSKYYKVTTRLYNTQKENFKGMTPKSETKSDKFVFNPSNHNTNSILDTRSKLFELSMCHSEFYLYSKKVVRHLKTISESLNDYVTNARENLFSDQKSLSSVDNNSVLFDRIGLADDIISIIKSNSTKRVTKSKELAEIIDKLTVLTRKYKEYFKEFRDCLVKQRSSN